MISDMLEILIGKSIDSEITPAEQQLLEEQLKTNPDAQILFHQLHKLHELSKQTITRDILDRGAAFETIFQRAAAQYHPPKFHRRPLPWNSMLRVAGSLAAGFLLGFGAFHFYGKSSMVSAPLKHSAPIVAYNDLPRAAEKVVRNTLPQAPAPKRIHPQRNQMDWYTYTDPSGTKWMIESPHSGSDIALAGYSGDL